MFYSENTRVRQIRGTDILKKYGYDHTTYDPTVDLYKYDQIRDTTFWKNTTSYKYEVVLRIPAVQFLLLLSQRVSMDMAIMWSPEEKKLVMGMKVPHSYVTSMVKSL